MNFAILPAILLLLLPGRGDAFSPQHHNTRCSTKRRQHSFSLNLFWFGKGDSDKEKNTGGEGLGTSGIAQVMDSMETFKTSQQVGLLTSNLVQDLQGTIVEGSAADGKVRVFMDGQQRPKRVEIDEVYGSEVNIDDLSAALLIAMDDAFIQSKVKMEEKMKDLYAELGLPPSATP